MADKAARYIDPPNDLKEKVGGDGPIEFDGQTMLAVQAVIDRHGKSYAVTVSKDIERLNATYQQAVDDRPKRAAHLQTVAAQVHEIRGMGGTYDYPLITKIGTSLYDFCQGASGTTAQMEVIKAHIDALRVVAKQKIRGDGGAAGAELLEGLRQAAGRNQAPDAT